MSTQEDVNVLESLVEIRLLFKMISEALDKEDSTSLSTSQIKGEAMSITKAAEAAAKRAYVPEY